MKRVLIIGPSASGKSALAGQLGEITGLRVIELDKIFWQPGLAETLRGRWAGMQHKLLDESEWKAISGSRSGHVGTRVAKAP